MKIKAKYRIYQNSSYDGTCIRAELDDFLDENGQSLGEDHDLWEEADDNRECELFLNTDNPSVYGQPDSEQHIFGHVIDTEDFINVDMGDNGDEGFYYLDLELDENGKLLTHGELVLVKLEGGSTTDGKNPIRVTAYFKGTPSPTELLKAHEDFVVGTLKFNEVTNHSPVRKDDAVSTKAGLERWVLEGTPPEEDGYPK